MLFLPISSSDEILSFLLDLGASPEIQTEDGLTPLHIASMWGRTELVKIILNSGADPLVPDNEGMLPIEYAQNEGIELDLCNYKVIV